MGKSHQTGSLVLRGKRWYGYYRKEVVGPTTDTVRVVRVVLRLGLKSQMTKLVARESLRAEIAKQTGKIVTAGSSTMELPPSNGLFGTATSRYGREIGGPRRRKKRRHKSRST